MQITLVNSTDLTGVHLQMEWNRLSTAITERLVAELYKTDMITFQQAHRLLKSSSWPETVEILKRYGSELYYDRDDYQATLETLFSLKQPAG
jgi:predicted HTH domain antitoxin